MPRKTAASAVAEAPRVTDAPEPTVVEEAVSTPDEATAAIQTAFPVAAPEAKPRAAKLTLSQRRALVVLHQDEIHRPATPFRALPYVYLVSVGLAEEGPGEDAGSYVLTDAGRDRAATINPAYRDWRAGGSVRGGSFAPDRVGAVRRAVEDARLVALEANGR